MAASTHYERAGRGRRAGNRGHGRLPAAHGHRKRDQRPAGLPTIGLSQHAPTGDQARPPVGLPVFQALAESISRCQQAGLARAGDDTYWLAAQVWAALHGLVLLWLNAPGFPWPGSLEQMADQAVARLIGLDTPADGHPA